MILYERIVMFKNGIVYNREIVGLAMFDFANQVYTTFIITVVFAVIFTRVIVGDGPDFRLGAPVLRACHGGFECGGFSLSCFFMIALLTNTAWMKSGA